MISAVSSLDSYTQASQTDPAKMLQQMLAKMFAQADTSGDGTISQDEFSQFLSANPRADRMLSRLVNPMSSIGTTGTDSATSTGAATPATASDIFKAIDTNGDGSISKDELAAAMQKARSHGHHHHGGTQDAQATDNSQASIIINLISSPSQADGSTSTTDSTGAASTVAAAGNTQSQLLAEILTQGAKIDIYA
jgi:Ca2+-binding EF-hand superfamily protein